MLGFILLLFILNIINLCLLISLLKEYQNHVDLLLDLEQNQRRIEKQIIKGNRKCAKK